MKEFKTVAELRAHLDRERRAGFRIGFVPTMGNLHDGHLALVREAAERSDRVVVSIFVNPLQFGAGEDLGAYPRTPREDREKLRAAGVDCLFIPGAEEVYPVPLEAHTAVEVPGLSDLLCGASRPGHFRGVTTVVAKLLNMVQADVAVFGEKDFQQLAIIRQMARDLCFPVEIVGLPTVREADGLAMSSRNNYLTEPERKKAPVLYQVLQEAARRLRAHDADFRAIEAESSQSLENAGFRTDYLSVRRHGDLLEAEPGDKALVIMAAAWMGRARLIDNVTVLLNVDYI